jgi:hypothetical protein
VLVWRAVWGHDGPPRARLTWVALPISRPAQPHSEAASGDDEHVAGGLLDNVRRDRPGRRPRRGVRAAATDYDEVRARRARDLAAPRRDRPSRATRTTSASDARVLTVALATVSSREGSAGSASAAAPAESHDTPLAPTLRIWPWRGRERGRRSRLGRHDRSRGWPRRLEPTGRATMWRVRAPTPVQGPLRSSRSDSAATAVRDASCDSVPSSTSRVLLTPMGPDDAVPSIGTWKWGAVAMDGTVAAKTEAANGHWRLHGGRNPEPDRW